MNKKKLFRIIKWTLFSYALLGIAFFYLQDYFLFRPVAIPSNQPFSFEQPFKELLLPYNETIKISIVQFTTKDTAKGVVLYFHGNRTNITRYASANTLFTNQGYEVWMIDYPGYGKSTGAHQEKIFYEFALQLYKLARARYQPNQIILYGRSLGSGIAAQLASIRDCKKLILETPYYSFPSIIGTYAPIYPMERMIQFKIPTWKYLQEVTAPVLILHGTNDWTIPLRNAEKLRPYLKEKDVFKIIDGGAHNDLWNFEETKRTIISSIE